MPRVPGPRPSHSSEARKVMSRRIRASAPALAGAGAALSSAVTAAPVSNGKHKMLGNHRRIRMGVTSRKSKTGTASDYTDQPSRRDGQMFPRQSGRLSLSWGGVVPKRGGSAKCQAHPLGTTPPFFRPPVGVADFASYRPLLAE